MKNIVPHIVTFLLGFAIATGLFININKPSLNHSNDTVENERQEQITSRESKQQPDPANATDKDQLIEWQAQELTRLKAEVSSIRKELNASLLTAKNQSTTINQPEPNSESESEAKLTTMNMQTFEESMKTQFTDQFKGVVLQLEGQQLKDIKQSFDQSSEKNEWSNQYENSIANFLATHDENGDHYLQSLNCNTRVCRLEVNTNDSDNWNSLYAKMTNEPWYQSITVQEKSEYPGNVIYYLPSLNN